MSPWIDLRGTRASDSGDERDDVKTATATDSGGNGGCSSCSGSSASYVYIEVWNSPAAGRRGCAWRSTLSKASAAWRPCGRHDAETAVRRWQW